MLPSGEYMTLNRTTGIIVRPEHGDIPEITLLSEMKSAKCWHCGAEIFYYQNEYGSKVLFKNLGKTWIKPECK